MAIFIQDRVVMDEETKKPFELSAWGKSLIRVASREAILKWNKDHNYCFWKLVKRKGG